MPTKLYIYDHGSSDDRQQASARFDGDEDVHTVPAADIQDLIARLDKLVGEGRTFDRALFQTHGYPGAIWFGAETNPGTVTARRLYEEFFPHNFQKLFPKPARIYFDGCNVAAGADGRRFLSAVGYVFLRTAGGVAFGWSSSGTWVHPKFPLLGGRTVRFTGDVVEVHFGPGAVEVPPPRPPHAGNWPDLPGGL
jgi:hypothetical protein